LGKEDEADKKPKWGRRCMNNEERRGGGGGRHLAWAEGIE
jgi:hypothetical protein